jgi:iron-sulfur cluster repair protein YtfE (RIC family)
MGPVEAFDDVTRPLAPKIAGVTPEQRAHGKRLRLYHRHHLQELARVRQAMEQLLEGQGSTQSLTERLGSMAMVENYRRFGTICGQQCQMLTMHHTIEDHSLFPILRTGPEGLRKVIDRLSAEHRVIHDLLMRFDASTRAIPRDPSPSAFADLRQAYEQLERFVVSHFGYEERELEEALGYYAVPI